MRRAISNATATLLACASACSLAAVGAERASASTLQSVPASTSSGQVDAAASTAAQHLGYWVSGYAGLVGEGGGAPNHGDLVNITPRAGIVGMAATPDGGGYWLVASDGGVFSFGDARFAGSTGAIHLNQPIVGMAATPDGGGYWLVASDGGVFSFGDARFAGSTGAIHLNQPMVGMAATPDGGGYWLVASDGGVFSFGHARFAGSTGAIHLARPIVGMADSTDGGGYWLAAADGGVFTFGNARYLGSAANSSLPGPVTAIARAVDGSGYWLLTQAGTVLGFGSSAGSIDSNPLVSSGEAIAADPAAVVATPPVPALGGSISPPVAPAQSSSPVSAALAYAKAQIGKPYIYGGTGPAGYDCSGLTMMAWRAAGVSLPRVASSQYFAGNHVPISQAQPGDLVFWATNPADPSTIYHVGLALGGGMVLDAPHTGTSVQIQPIWSAGLVSVVTRP